MFKTLKKQLIMEEKAFRQLRKHFPNFKSVRNDEIYQYLGINSTKELVELVEKLPLSSSEQSEFPLSAYGLKTLMCTCTDSEGNTKYLYPTQKEAVSVCKYHTQIKFKMKVYPCPESNGWHISKG